MNLVIVLVIITVLLNLSNAAPNAIITNDDLIDGKYLCEAGTKKYDGPFIVRILSATNGQTLSCFVCGQQDYKTHVKSCVDRLILEKAGGSSSSHRAEQFPFVIKMDPIYNRDSSWSSKLKRNFDEIDKASASFSILNQLVK
ncbi:uncharacterized protein Dwil_GK19099 [Drosophila willistoni]|uniref:Secreted protein n=1 Tax=Drosophila willistoni TaxID=7260 RepID=B4MRN0_DROWI|nr:uncharacterized protein LOC6641001 isoform X1 [Drosophila willistoni]EDW74769.1 uncharacterized protein Dwil_GK19099 [Drosophila willistoni]